MSGAQHTVPKTGRIGALPRNAVGYPIPFFAATVDGQRDLREADPKAFVAAVQGACWVCGQPRRVGRRHRQDAFVIGPMCAVNRVTAEPPCHLDCAVYSVRVCPFLSRPDMVRRDTGMPEERTMPGIPIMRNPGVSAIWVTDKWKTFRDPIKNGIMFSLEQPSLNVQWWACGRAATRTEVIAAIDSGMPALRAVCDDDPRSGTHSALDLAYQRALKHLPPQ